MHGHACIYACDKTNTCHALKVGYYSEHRLVKQEGCLVEKRLPNQKVPHVLILEEHAEVGLLNSGMAMAFLTMS